MVGISLIFVGITLIINGISLIKKYNEINVAIINIFTAFLIYLLNFYSILTNTIPVNFVGYLGGLLFGTTNLLIACDLLLKQGMKTTGIYCGLAFIVACAIAVFNLVLGNYLKGGLWFAWSLIWLFAFVAFSIAKKFKMPANIMFIVQGVSTTFIFGFLILFGIVVW